MYGKVTRADFWVILQLTTKEIENKLKWKHHNFQNTTPQLLTMLTTPLEGVGSDVHQQLQDEARTVEEHFLSPQPLKERQPHSCTRKDRNKSECSLYYATGKAQTWTSAGYT